MLPVTPMTIPLNLSIALAAELIRYSSGLLTEIIFDELAIEFKIFFFLIIAKEAPLLIASSAKKLPSKFEPVRPKKTEF